LSAVGFAFLIYARHATHREYLAVVGDYLLVQLMLAGETSCFKLDLRELRGTCVTGGNLVTLTCSGTRIDVGRHLTEWTRREFAQERRCAFIASNVVK